MLEVEGIKVYYGDVPVLRNVSLAVNEGEIVTVIGPNGAGKTTLLKAIVNLLPLGRGERGGKIFYLGEDLRAAAGRNHPERDCRRSRGGAGFAEMTVWRICTWALISSRQKSSGRNSGRNLQTFSPPEGAPDAESRNPERWRTTDAGDRPGAHGPSHLASPR